MKKIAVCILVSLLVATSVVSYSESLSKELSAGIVRLHIIAESNSKEDQAVKLKVRDALLKEMEMFENTEDVKLSLARLEAVADNVLKKEGFAYSAKAEYGQFDFPTKHYDGFSLPKGSRENTARESRGRKLVVRAFSALMHGGCRNRRGAFKRNLWRKLQHGCAGRQAARKN